VGKAEAAIAGFEVTLEKIGGALPGFADGKAEELFEKVKSLRDFADGYKKKSAIFMEDGRHMLLDLSEAANNMTRKIDPTAVAPAPQQPPRRLQQKRQ